MEQHDQQVQWQLVETLWEMRKAGDDTDFYFVSGKARLPLHKLVLQATFFDSGGRLQSKIKNRIVVRDSEIDAQGQNMFNRNEIEFNGIKKNILEAILYYIYTGNIASLESVEHLKKVACFSNDIGLKKLEQHCFEILAYKLHPKMCIELWKVAAYCNNTAVKTFLCERLLFDIDIVKGTKSFRNIGPTQIKALLEYAKKEKLQIDNLFEAIFEWLRNKKDVKLRNKFAKELLPLADSSLVSKECLRKVKTDDVKQGSRALTRMSDIGKVVNEFAKHVFHPIAPPPRPPLGNQRAEAKYLCRDLKLVVLRGLGHEAKCEEKNASNNFYHAIEVLDVCTMTWYPSKTLYFRIPKGSAMCWYNNFLCLACGSLESTYFMYDTDDFNEYVIPIHIKDSSRTESKLCVFKDKLYVIGGCLEGKLLQTIFCSTPGGHQWEQVVSLKYPVASPTVLTTSQYLYVCHTSTTHKPIIQQFFFVDGYNHLTGRNIISLSWFSIPLEVKVNFYVSNDVMKIAYANDESTIKIITYDHNAQRQWTEKHHELPKYEKKRVREIVTFDGAQVPFLFVKSNIENHSHFPDAIFDPQTNNLYPFPNQTIRDCVDNFGGSIKPLLFTAPSNNKSAFNTKFFINIVGFLGLMKLLWDTILKLLELIT